MRRPKILFAPARPPGVHPQAPRRSDPRLSTGNGWQRQANLARHLRSKRRA